jgi:hypothetical protein
VAVMDGTPKGMERPLTSVLRRRDTEPLRTRTGIPESDATLKGDRGEQPTKNIKKRSRPNAIMRSSANSVRRSRNSSAMGGR